MTAKHLATAIVMALFTLVGNACLIAQVPQEPQIYWVQSPQKAMSLARQFNTPILVYVTSDHCGYCRKMEREVWSNPQIISMVETGFIPLALNAERDAKIVAALKIRAFPTTLLFTRDAKFVTGATGYLPPNQLAGMLRTSQQSQSASQVTQNQ